MSKKQLTLVDIRRAIDDLRDSELSEDVRKMSDEAFLKCELEEDLGLDSMDIVDFTLNLENNCNICLPHHIVEDIKRDGQTVEKCLNVCNALLF